MCCDGWSLKLLVGFDIPESALCRFLFFRFDSLLNDGLWLPLLLRKTAVGIFDGFFFARFSCFLLLLELFASLLERETLTGNRHFFFGGAMRRNFFGVQSEFTRLRKQTILLFSSKLFVYLCFVNFFIRNLALNATK